MNNKHDPELVAAFDAMTRRRPLKPPPMPRGERPRKRAGELALAREKRLGIVGDDRGFFEGEK